MDLIFKTDKDRISFFYLLKAAAWLAAVYALIFLTLEWVWGERSAAPLAIVLYIILVANSISLNSGNFSLGPAIVHIAYFSLYVFIPAVALYMLKLTTFVGRSISIVINDFCMMALCVYMLGFIIGSILIGKGKSTPPAPILNNIKQPGQRLALYGLVILALGLTFSFIIPNFSGIKEITLKSFSSSDHYVEVQEFKTEALFGANYLLQGVNQIIPIAILFFMVLGYSTKNPRYLRQAAFLAGTTIIFQFITGGLWVGFSILVMALLIHAYFVPESSKNVGKYAVGLVSVVFVAIALKYGFSSKNESGADYLMLSTFHRFSAGARQLQYVLDNSNSYQFGFTYIRDLIAMIPSPIKRPLFPEEFWGGFNSVIFYKMYGFYGGTAQVPIIGEFYTNGGISFVFLGAILQGAAIQKISNMLRYRQFKTTFGVISAVIIGYRLGECVVEGIGTRLFVSTLWIFIFYIAVREIGNILEIAISAKEP